MTDNELWKLVLKWRMQAECGDNVIGRSAAQRLVDKHYSEGLNQAADDLEDLIKEHE